LEVNDHAPLTRWRSAVRVRTGLTSQRTPNLGLARHLAELVILVLSPDIHPSMTITSEYLSARLTLGRADLNHRPPGPEPGRISLIRCSQQWPSWPDPSSKPSTCSIKALSFPPMDAKPTVHRSRMIAASSPGAQQLRRQFWSTITRFGGNGSVIFQHLTLDSNSI